MATIYIDDRPYEVEEGKNLLHIGLSLGLNIPYFCWHPAMGSVGACRLCAVKQFKDENDKKGKLVMSCLTEVRDGMRFSIEDPEARLFRKSVLEWLMINHPHDCPVCDEGGECHLQDMTVMTGHDYRRYRFTKRTYRNQDLGPLVNHEMNRCIQCYRCVRFYGDYAGGKDLQVFGAHDHVYFGRYEDGVLQSEFSGNLVEVCPTGVFTDKTLKRHYTRKWDLETAPSVCVHCSVGCNTIPGARYGTLRRIRNRYNRDVNGYFLCDRGRYGYEFVNGPSRIRTPIVRHSGAGAETVERKEALRLAERFWRGAVGIIGIGSPRASLESNFALRTFVGPENFCSGMTDAEFGPTAAAIDILRSGPARSASLHDVMQSDAVLVLGEDIAGTAPMIALALRQSVLRQPIREAEKLHIPSWLDYAIRDAVQQKRGPLFIATPDATRLDDAARRTIRAAPDEIARLGFAVARSLGAPLSSFFEPDSGPSALADEIAAALDGAEKPLVVSGTGLRNRAIIEAAADVAWALRNDRRTAGLCFSFPECNTSGAALLGGMTLDEAFRAVREGRANTVFILENDLYRRGETAEVDDMLSRANVVVFDHTATRTAERAQVVLPVAPFSEADGTLLNNEGRAQRSYRVLPAGGEVQESWRWVQDIYLECRCGTEERWMAFDELTADLANHFPVFREVPEIAPPAGFRIAGQKIPRQPHRSSGRTAMHADVDVHEPEPPEDPDAPLSFSMEGYPGQPPPALVREYWSPGWNSVQALNKFQSEIDGPLRGGEAGRRLLEPGGNGKPSYFETVPPPPGLGEGELWAVPLYHVFGSEELSALSPGIAELAPQPYLGLNPAVAGRLRLGEGEEAVFEASGSEWKLPVRLMPSLGEGVAGIPHGLPGWRGPVTPVRIRLHGTI